MTKELNILIVDDSRVVRSILEDELKLYDYKTFSAASAKEAEDIISKHDIDIMFLDLKLPGISGLDYLKKLKEKKSDIIVIVMTAYESSSSAVKAIDCGAYDYVVKPIEPSEIELIVQRALKRFQIEQEKKDAVERRLKALERFEESFNDMEHIIDNLKREVDELLKELGREPKYKS